MQIVTTSVTVADYCNAMARGEIRVNRDYQRSDKVWPLAARSYLIETILLGFPIPKLYLHQRTDLKSRQTIKEIVDGQQRSRAILDFFQNTLRLGRTLDLDEARGRTYDELTDELQARFIDYGLTYDLLVAATPDRVREVFRRMNSYTVPLNAEEQRHALYQGQFKWFLHRLSSHLDETFVTLGIFGPKQLVRMADSKLLAELVHAVVFGITTTKKPDLDALYRDNDAGFDQEETLRASLQGAFDQLLLWEPLHKSPLMKPHVVYALLLAVMHRAQPIASLTPVAPPSASPVDDDTALENLSVLAEALEASEEETPARLRRFVAASSSATNVSSQRQTRFLWMYRALTEESV
jgi:hypothetical protein